MSRAHYCNEDCIRNGCSSIRYKGVMGHEVTKAWLDVVDDVLGRAAPPVLPIRIDPDGAIYFMGNGIELLKLAPSGRIFVEGHLAANDEEIVTALREFREFVLQGLKVIP